MSGDGYANSGIHRFANLQPYRPPAYNPPTFQAPMLPMRQGFNPPSPPSLAGFSGLPSYGGGEGSAPASSPGSMPSGLLGPVAIGISAITGLPTGLIGLGLNAVNGQSPEAGLAAAVDAGNAVSGIDASAGIGDDGTDGVDGSVGVGDAAAVGAVGDAVGDGGGGGGGGK